MTSLLQPHPDPSMRTTNDKEIGIFDLDGLFDQYVETDLLQEFSDTTAEPSRCDDLAHLFELPPSNGRDSTEPSPMPNWDASSWHKPLQNLGQNPASRTIASNSSSIYPDSRGKASLSNPELFNFDDLFELDNVEPRLSLSTPSTPNSQIARPAKKVRSTPERRAPHGIHKSTKKSTISSMASKIMRPSHHRVDIQDLWTRKIDGTTADTFSLQMPPNGLPNSPPPSTKLVRDEHSENFFPRDQPYTIAMSPLAGEATTPNITHTNYQITPLSSPAIDTNSRNDTGDSFGFSNDNMATAYISRHISNAALSALQTPPPSHRLSMETWAPDTPANLDFSFPASPEFQTPSHAGKMTDWWHNSTQPSTSTPAYHTSNSRSRSQNMSFSSASVAGLGIVCDTASFSGFGPDLHADPSSIGDHQHKTPSNDFSASASFDIGYTTKNDDMYTQQGVPIGTTPPSRSPSLSPQPRFTRRRHSSNNNNNNNTKSSIANRRKSSNSSNQSTLRASVGFVNFTPDDSRKILTGVAPSGSSKTKARREKEAAEKRRKLSQAAMKAVIEAGGDLRRLEKEGLFMEM